MCLRGCEGRSKGGVGMSRSSGIWVLAFVCLVLVLASSMMNVTDPAPVASNPTAAPWSVLGDSTFTFAYGGDMGANGSHAPTALARLRADLANLSFFLAVGDLSYSTQAGKIGRASCRERVEVGVVAEGGKETKTS